jgi:hypothetical protein
MPGGLSLADLGRDHPDALTAHLRGRPITLDYGRWKLHPALVPRPGTGSGGGLPNGPARAREL